MDSKLPSVGTNSNLRVLLVILALLVLGIGVVSLAQNAQQRTQTQVPPDQQQGGGTSFATTAKSTILYGVWEGSETVIHAVNADGTGDQVVVRVPLEVKNINRLDSNRLIYIANTNALDHGDSIEIRNVSNGQTQRVVTAGSGWGIDSIIVSGDGKWIAYWEVQMGPTGQLINGQSRVYTANLSSLPAQPNLVFDEPSPLGSIVHYPLFIDHSGNLYADGFSPNKDGWGHGFVKTQVAPSSPNQFVEVMADANYNSDPRLSPTSNTIVYTAYNPAAGTPMKATGTSGRTTTESLNPNTVMLLNLDTNSSRPLTSEQNRLYYDLTWKDDGSQLFVRSYGSDGTQLKDAQAISIDVNSGVATQWDTSKIIDGIILGYGPDGLITGIGHDSGATGNLGKTYSPVLAGIAVGDGSNVTTIPAANAQFITTVPGTVPVSAGDSRGSLALHLATFNLKPQLAERPVQQNDLLKFDPNIKPGTWCQKVFWQLTGSWPKDYFAAGGLIAPTRTIFTPEVNTTIGRDPSLQLGQFGPKAQTETVNVPFNLTTWKDVKPILLDQYKCSTSPLYLYPTQPSRVQVTLSTDNEILWTNLPYSKESGWNLMADPKGTKIAYDYTAKVTVPDYGLVVSAAKLESTLDDYGRKVGLKGRELSDYVTFWTGYLPEAEYYLVTHLANPSSVMGFEITPKPDVMIQTIMYFKPLTTEQAAGYSDLPEPSFESVPTRTGFTAVDWSGVIDY